MQCWSSSAGPLLYAHRGASIEAPENTRIAFRRALELGADVLELDLHASSDGVFVITHDETGERTCNVARAIRATPWSEISTWDAGFGYTDQNGERPFAGKGIHPVRFDELLSELGDCALNVDIKEASDQSIRALVALLRSERRETQVLLTSFSKSRIESVRACSYSGPVGLSRPDVIRLFGAPEWLNRWFPFRGERAQIPPQWLGLDLGDARFIDKARRLGLLVDYWVINSVEEAEALLENGAAGIITDDPARMAELFRRSPRTSEWRRRHPVSSAG